MSIAANRAASVVALYWLSGSKSQFHPSADLIELDLEHLNAREDFVSTYTTGGQGLAFHNDKQALQAIVKPEMRNHRSLLRLEHMAAAERQSQGILTALSD